MQSSPFGMWKNVSISREDFCLGKAEDAISKGGTVAGMSESSGRVTWSIYKKVCYPTTNFIPYFSIDNAHIMYNAHPKLFDISFDV
jgi:hypothetical protein